MTTTSLGAANAISILAPVARAIRRFERRFPRESGDTRASQPIHTVYGGAHLFTVETIGKLSRLALRSFDEHAADPLRLATIFDIPDLLALQIHPRVRRQLESRAIEDFRIDFEDGFGARPPEDEDREAIRSGGELARALRANSMPTHFGIRIKALGGPTGPRALRTLDLFMTALSTQCPLIVTLPKVRVAEEVQALDRALTAIERKLNWRKGITRIEVMLETPQLLPQLEEAVDAAGARCLGVHFGAYDYTSALGISASCQTLSHPACDRVRLEMQSRLAGKNVFLCDGASHRMPVGSTEAVIESWRESHSNVRRALAQGYTQGWDLHPAQIAPRLVAMHAFYRESIEISIARLKGYLDKAFKAGLTGNFFDDAASAQGVHRHLAQGIACGALDDEDLAPLGLIGGDLVGRTFAECLRFR